MECSHWDQPPALRLFIRSQTLEVRGLQASEVKSMAVLHTPLLTFTHMSRLRSAPMCSGQLYKKEGRSAGRGLMSPGLGNWTSILKTTVWPETSYFTPLGLRFFICKMKGVGLHRIPKSLPELRFGQATFLTFLSFPT